MPKTVLIVEDNELNMKLFNDLVETQGCRTVQTRSGVEAVELARNHRPDLILMDIQLPEVSGLQATQWLKTTRSCAHSSRGGHRFRDEGRRRKDTPGRCEAYLSKPISVVKFLETIDTSPGRIESMTARVLVVDDIPPNMKLLEARLSAEYFEVLTATNGPEAIEICEKGQCDIVLLDVMMPGMDGFEVCRRLKSQAATAHLPIVLVTALDEPADRVRESKRAQTIFSPSRSTKLRSSPACARSPASR